MHRPSANKPASERRKRQSSSWLAVVRTYQECNRRYAQLLQAFDLTIAQFDVLTAIHQLGDRAIPKVIAQELLVTRGNITGVLHRLQDRNLLRTYGQAHDGRSYVCELTSSGTALLKSARSAAAMFIDQQLAPFSDSELRDTEKQMNRMRRHLETIDPQAIANRAIAIRGDKQEKVGKE